MGTTIHSVGILVATLFQLAVHQCAGLQFEILAAKQAYGALFDSGSGATPESQDVETEPAVNLLRRSLLALLILELWAFGAAGQVQDCRVLGAEICCYYGACKMIVYKKRLSKYKKVYGGRTGAQADQLGLGQLAIGFLCD